MLPMALGLGEGGEQNAPLARAVIGGLTVATFATLFFVPLMFTVIHAQSEITKSTIKARQDSLQLTQSLDKYGAGSLADTRQAEELLHAAQANLPELRRQIATQENTISILLGHNPEGINGGLNVADRPHPQEVPTGVPSQLLEHFPF
jgi:multidrug efflux system outer membrane protein